LISACLLGEAVRYDGGSCLQHLDDASKQRIMQWQAQGLLLGFCPEVSGGLPIPRPVAEIQGNRVKTQAGEDVTQAFEDGAAQALKLCKAHDIHIAILKQGSPSCGNSLINDGSFTKTKIAGMGITAKLLSKHGISVYNEQQIQQIQSIQDTS
jgi:uncharacterized protein YbbK (DUF523 family)